MRRSGIAIGAVLFACLWGTEMARGEVVFTQEPSPYAANGAGPFDWSFQSDDPGYGGGLAYKSSVDAAWTRCKNLANVSLANLADGTHTLTIKADYSADYASSHGFGIPSECSSGADPGSTLLASRSFLVDSVAPSLGTPMVAANAMTAQVSVTASDGASGIDHYRWSMGDGYTATTTSGFISHTYLNHGSYDGSVTVRDRAGNEALQPFQVSLAPATDGPPNSDPPGIPPNSDPPGMMDSDPPQTLILKKPPAKSKQRRIKFVFSSDEPGSTFACTLDGTAFRTCASPKKFNVAVGWHKFSVRASDQAGNADLRPANVRFRVVR